MAIINMKLPLQELLASRMDHILDMVFFQFLLFHLFHQVEEQQQQSGMQVTHVLLYHTPCVRVSALQHLPLSPYDHEGKVQWRKKEPPLVMEACLALLDRLALKMLVQNDSQNKQIPDLGIVY
jgi:hypothetical protein